MANLVDELKNNPKIEGFVEDHATYYVEHGELTPGYEPVAKMIEEAKEKQKEIQER